jgi:uncharacterized protein (DUF1800 family)
MLRRRGLIAGAAFGGIGSVLLAGCATPSLFSGRSSSPSDAADLGGLALVNRVTWGVDSAAVAALRRMPRRDYLESQLHPVSNAALPPAAQSQIDALPLLQKPMDAWVQETEQQRRDAQAITDDEAKKTAQQAYQQDLNRLARDAASRMLLRALYSPNQLQEQMTWFWFNHFNVHQYKSNLRVMVGDYEDRLRPLALGRFHDLLIASATHAAMIRYLDNEQNAANRINENYAREVMELHTLGVDGGYTQKDVQELARVLTGLGINFGERPVPTISNPGTGARAQPSSIRSGTTSATRCCWASAWPAAVGTRSSTS